jgi:sugar O-acyltransferase (sialic acid O-acetyltransferase NeuD family)
MKLAIFGYGGHAREVASQINNTVDFFVDNEYSNEYVRPISTFNPEVYMMMIAVADPKKREEIVKKLPKETRYFKFIHPTAQIFAKDFEIGEGSFIGAYSIVTTNVKIGKHAILNRGNQIGHDVNIGDYFSAMPGAIVSGNVIIGDRVYMGTNSSIIENKSIYSDTTIGANGVVVENITIDGVYVGVPAKLLKK